jgi:nucleoid DNA-binding protein
MSIVVDCPIVQRKRVLAGGKKVHLRDFGKLSVHRYIGCTGEDIQAEAEEATSGFRGDKPGRKDDQGDED